MIHFICPTLLTIVFMSLAGCGGGGDSSTDGAQEGAADTQTAQATWGETNWDEGEWQ